MNRINTTFEALKADGKAALIPFITAGDPNPDFTVGMMHALVDAGADIIELGVPFSDPMADGPVIQKASERALEHNVRLRDVIDMVAEFRQTNDSTPVVLMGYLNPVEIMGYQVFADLASKAGVDGVLTVDLPPEEGHEFNEIMDRYNLAPVYLIAPTSTPVRMQKICNMARGFVYSVALKGVTGSSELNTDMVAEKMAVIREYATTPVGVGFGIRTPEAAATVAKASDAVIVGSVLVNKIAENQDNPEQAKAEIVELLSAMKQAMNEVSK